MPSDRPPNTSPWRRRCYVATFVALMLATAAVADWRKARECSATINTVKIVWPKGGEECRAVDVLTLLGQDR